MATQPHDDSLVPSAEPDILESVRSMAYAAARRAGVAVRGLETMTDITAAADLAARVWKTDDTAPLDSSLMRAFAHSGNYVAGAFADEGAGDGPPVGMSVGFAAARPALSLHSHMTCTSDDRRDRGLGYALKLHQRAWAVERGFTSVTWTFDPLVRRNAYFNLVKLGARVAEYIADFYGSMDDGVNVGDESDRLFLTWALRDADDSTPSTGGTGLTTESARAVVLEVGGDGEPVRTDSDRDLIACQVPPDIVDLRERDPRAGLRWRRALRDALGGALDRGYRVDGFTRSGHYLLRRDRRADAAGGG